MADLRTFFTDAFENLSDKEEFYKAVFMNMEGDEALQARNEYYRRRFRSCGKNVNIGVGVTIIGAENISVGDNVSICNDVTICAHGSVTIGSGTVVVKPIPPYSVAVGNPARVIRKRGEAKK